jgi:hypothetical protein
VSRLVWEQSQSRTVASKRHLCPELTSRDVASTAAFAAACCLLLPPLHGCVSACLALCWFVCYFVVCLMIVWLFVFCLSVCALLD